MFNFYNPSSRLYQMFKLKLPICEEMRPKLPQTFQLEDIKWVSIISVGETLLKAQNIKIFDNLLKYKIYN